jgi:UDP-N-acetylglucosamine transferase subunit ALG13
MIFLTVGSQLPFDRLTKSVDAWASDNPDVEVFGQIGNSDYTPQNIKFTVTLNPEEYQSMIDACEIIISHVGMGTIISALDMGKPLLVMPRRAENGEVRNNHQFSTIKFVKHYKLIEVANDEAEIGNLLDKMIAQKNDTALQPEHLVVARELIDEINNFIKG